MLEPNREKEIFEQALDIESPEERDAFVRNACGGNDALIQRIHALLKVSEAAPDFLPEGAGRDDLDQPGGSLTEGPGTVIGRYKLLEQIGEGGFGYVYMAEQLEPVRRRVALKIIKPGMDSKQVIGRFEAERQALALMDHPNIAQIYDAGTTDGRARHSVRAGVEPFDGGAQGTDAPYLSSGRPYFVMELVKGIPITNFCEEQQLNLEARLKLFIQVCSAVQHAHQKGIIHRDLKPTNILVTLHGDQPVPKVIDFGIAKATQQPLTDKTVFTQFQHFIGTPAYMSPEQATLSALDVDTRSDIYSLGVLLYELLTGSPPFETKELLSVGLDEMRRIIREKDPDRPSTRIRKTSASSSQPPLVTRHSSLATDLDWIVMKALEKDRARRYETANGLAADLKRYLSHEPVTAVAPTLVYQLTKFYQRNRRFARMAGAFGILLLLATGFSLWQAHRATLAKEEQTRLREEADRQRAAAETAGQLAADRAEELARQIYYKNIEDAAAAIDRGDQEIARKLLVDCDTAWRQWEWYYLFDALPSQVVLPATEQPVFTRAGRLIMIAAGDQNHLVKMWDPAAGKLIRTVIENDAAMCFLSQSADGQLLATGQTNGVVKLRDASGHLLWSVKAHTGRTDGLAFSPDGASLASCSWDGTVKLWDVSTGMLFRDWGPFDRALRGVVISPDGQRIAVGNTGYASQGELTVWSVRTGEAVIRLQDTPRTFKDVVFSPDGRWIATSSKDGVVKLWDASTGGLLRALPSASPRPGLKKDCIVFGDNASRLVVADSTGVRILEPTTGDLLLDLRLTDVAACFWAALSPDNRRLAAFVRNGDGKYETLVWDLKPAQPETLDAHQNFVLGVACSQDGQTLASSSSDGTLKVWDAASHALKRSIVIRGGWPLAFSANGREIFGGGRLLSRWNLETGERLMSYQASEEILKTCAVSPNGKQLVTAGHDKIARIWDIDSGRLLHELQGHSTGCQSIYSVAYSPDGSLVASAACDATLRIWDADSGRPLRILHASDPNMQLISTVFSPDGRLVLAGSAGNNSIHVWDLESGTQLMRLSGGHDGMVWGLAMSPDGQRIASGGELGMLTLWDVSTGHRLISRDSGQGSIWTLAWSPDGRTIVTGGGDGTIKFWRGDVAEASNVADK